MKTDETISIELKKERIRIFNRLYTLPWLISVSLLIAVCSFTLFAIKQLHTARTEPKAFYPIETEREFKREHPFNVADYKLGEKLGINLEENIIEGVNWAIDKSYTECAGMSDTNMIILKGAIKKAIRREFDGFETYHKLKH